FQAEDGIRDFHVTGVQTCALPICSTALPASVRSCTLCTGTSRSNCSLIWARTFGVATVTTVIRERCLSCSISLTVSESILNPRRSEERRVGKEGRARGGA